MTGSILGQYLNKDGSYYRVGNNPNIDNPDERIHQDVDAVVSQTLSLALTFIDSVVTLISFGAVLWAISNNLTYIVVGYSLVGSAIILLFGRKLVSLNFMQLKLEADFRYSLIHVRNHTEAIRFYRGEDRELGTVRGRFGKAVDNSHKLINWSANVGFFQTAFDYFVTIIPYPDHRAALLCRRRQAGHVPAGVHGFRPDPRCVGCRGHLLPVFWRSTLPTSIVLAVSLRR